MTFNNGTMEVDTIYEDGTWVRDDTLVPNNTPELLQDLQGNEGLPWKIWKIKKIKEALDRRRHPDPDPCLLPSVPDCPAQWQFHLCLRESQWDNKWQLPWNRYWLHKRALMWRPEWCGYISSGCQQYSRIRSWGVCDIPPKTVCELPHYFEWVERECNLWNWALPFYSQYTWQTWFGGRVPYSKERDPGTVRSVWEMCWAVYIRQRSSAYLQVWDKVDIQVQSLRSLWEAFERPMLEACRSNRQTHKWRKHVADAPCFSLWFILICHDLSLWAWISMPSALMIQCHSLHLPCCQVRAQQLPFSREWNCCLGVLLFLSSEICSAWDFLHKLLENSGTLWHCAWATTAPSLHLAAYKCLPVAFQQTCIH